MVFMLIELILVFGPFYGNGTFLDNGTGAFV